MNAHTKQNKYHVAHVRQLPVWAKVAGLIIFAAMAYIASQYVVGAVVGALGLIGVTWQLTSPVSLLILRVVVYILMVAMLLGGMWLYRRHLSLADIGLVRLAQWRDIGLSLVGALAYVALTLIVATIAQKVPGYDSAQVQDLGFSRLYSTELLVAFIALVILTPIFEEIIFRGFLYGRLRKFKVIPWWVSAMIVSALFGLAHMQWNVGLDVFCLSMVACVLRELTDSIWAGILLHMMKNMLAFVVTFVFVQSFIGG